MATKAKSNAAPAAKKAPAVFNAGSTLIRTTKDSKALTVTVTPYHKTLHAAIATYGKAEGTARAALHAVVSAHYKEKPAYEAYAADHAALKAQCEQDGTSYEYQRKEYNSVIMSLFKLLPVSTSAAAIKKAAQRKLAKQKQKQALITMGLKNAPKNWTAVPLNAEIGDDGKSIVVPDDVEPTRGAPKGEVQEHPVSVNESIEQFIARVGEVAVIEALTNVLAVEPVTESAAKALAHIAAQLRRERKDHETAKAEPAPKARKPRAPKAA